MKMKLTHILIITIVAILPLLVNGAHGRKNRLGCSSNSECILACRRTCLNMLQPLCYRSQCYCHVGNLRNEYLRMNVPNEPIDIDDYEMKQV